MKEFDFDDKQNFVIVVILLITAGLGVLGSSFTITTFLLFKDARNVATSFIFCLALADFLSGIANGFFWIYFDHKDWLVCNLQGGILMFGLCASLLWGLMIGCYLFLALYKNLEIEKIDRFSYLFHLLTWGYSFVAAILPMFYGKYGVMMPGSVEPKLVWCWVYEPQSKFRLLLYAPDSFIFILLIFLYGLIQHRIRNTQNSAAQRICKKMSIYLLTYTLLNIFAITNRYIILIFGAQHFVLYVLQFATQPAQGFLNAFAYAWNEPAFIDNYKNLFARCTSQHASKYQKLENARLLSYVCYDNESTVYGMQ